MKKQTDSTTVNQFYEDYLDTTSTNDIPQNELIITIFDGEILHEKLTNERKYIPYFDSFSDLQKYIGNDVELYYLDKNTNTDIQMKEQKDYDDCKSKKQEFKIEYIDPKNIKEDKDDIFKEYLLERYRSDIRAKKIDKDKNKQTQKKTDTKNKPTPNKTNPTQNKINNSNSNSQLKTNKCCCDCCKKCCKNKYR